jgi:predicted AlkP superfamily pyrophosphatase or phosphodiesterase
MAGRFLRVLSQPVALALVWSLLWTAAPAAQTPRPPAGPAARAARLADPAVRLVLLVAVDQFRADYLTRFGPPRAGFRTLMTRGATFTNAYLEHGITVTAVGHSTMLTGATPNVSGIIDNAWYERSTKSNVESVTDTEARIVGGDDGAGVGVSPRRMLVPTLGDQLKLSSSAIPGTPQAPRIIGISLKDRSAILTAGHSADGVYFFRGGRFVTSTFYRPSLPAWVEAVNALRIPDSYAGKTWAYEGGTRAYPTEVGNRLNTMAAAGPVGNELVLAMAKAALEHEQLGQRGVTDVLTVSFSSNDSVGHTYGPESPEVRDMTHQADRQVQQLLDEVDRRVGLAHVLVAFTADHGVAPLPETAAALRIPGGRFKPQVVLDAIDGALDAKYGAATWVERLSLPHVYLDQTLLTDKGVDPAEARRVAAAAAARVAHVARVYTREAILDGLVTADHISTLVTRAYHRDRSGDLHVVLEPHWTTAATGTSHGTVYGYDAHVPLILMGPGVEPGVYPGRVALNDLAPTLATLLGIETPTGSQGRPLVEAMRRGAHGALPAAARTSGPAAPAAVTPANRVGTP